MACLLFHNLMHGENKDQLTPGCSNAMFSHGCILLATVVCSILGELLQVSHSSEEVLALKKEIARCQVEADKLRTAISLNKVCSSSRRCKRPSQILPCRRPSNIPPPPLSHASHPFPLNLPPLCIAGPLVCCTAGFCTQLCSHSISTVFVGFSTTASSLPSEHTMRSSQSIAAALFSLGVQLACLKGLQGLMV